VDLKDFLLSKKRWQAKVSTALRSRFLGMGSATFGDEGQQQ
jgi:hypothetical protein